MRHKVLAPIKAAVRVYALEWIPSAEVARSYYILER
jgi:hypothetical protein